MEQEKETIFWFGIWWSSALGLKETIIIIIKIRLVGLLASQWDGSNLEIHSLRNLEQGGCYETFSVTFKQNTFSCKGDWNPRFNSNVSKMVDVTLIKKLLQER